MSEVITNLLGTTVSFQTEVGKFGRSTGKIRAIYQNGIQLMFLVELSKGSLVRVVSENCDVEYRP